MRSLFSFTWELGSGWACLDQFLADRVEREETNWMKVKVLSPKSFCCSLLLSVLDTVLLTKVLANKSEKIFPASKCSKDLLGIIITFLYLELLGGVPVREKNTLYIKSD